MFANVATFFVEHAQSWAFAHTMRKLHFYAIAQIERFKAFSQGCAICVAHLQSNLRFRNLRWKK